MVEGEAGAPVPDGADGAGGAQPESLAALRELGGQLSVGDRARIVQQALVLLEDLYVHLPLKRAMYAQDAVQALRLLATRLEGLTDAQFHGRMLSAFTSLRDLHTQYLLPRPFSSRIAFLPFLPEEFFESGRRGYVVTKLLPGFTHPTFRPGVVLTHWNGVRIERAVELNAERQAGGNDDARLARGLETLCFRPMRFTALPDEDWVVVSYTDGSERFELRLDWQVVDTDSPESLPVLSMERKRLLFSSPHAVDATDSSSGVTESLGIDAREEVIRRTLKVLFAPAAMEQEAEMEARGAALDAAPTAPEGTSVMPDVFSFRAVDTEGGTFGYIRLWTFNVRDADAFVAEFVRIAGLLPQAGLILDVRGNPGGLITAGEQLLQVLTPRTIDPERLQFVNTPLTQRLVQHVTSLSPWRESAGQAIETGAVYSLGFPLHPVDAYNQVGQQYCGPVVLITDALCYSTTDIFAAGFQDHEIGPIIGTSGNTGAGGANVWSHELLRKRLTGRDSPLQPLPRGASFNVALRRTTRVGARSGVAVEDLGVRPDKRYQMTRADVLGSNEGLIAFAGQVLAEMRGHTLTASVTSEQSGTLAITLETQNLSHVDVFLGTRPVHTIDVTDGEAQISIDAGGRAVTTMDLQGFDEDRLVARKRLVLPPRG